MHSTQRAIKNMPLYLRP